MSEKNTTIPTEEAQGFIRKEVIDHKGSHDISGTNERLVSFRSHVQHLNSALAKLNQMRNNASAPSLEKALNELLEKKGFGGKNGGQNHKAYFRTEGSSLVLVINTVVDGKPNTNIGDIETLLGDIDTVFSGKKTSPEQEKKEQENIGKDFAHFQRLLVDSERQLRETNTAYREETNDVYRLFDAISEATGNDSGRKGYERSIAVTQEMLGKEYMKFCKAFEGKTLSPHDRLLYEFQKRRFQAVLSQKIETPESFIHYVTHSKESLTYALEGAKGMKDGAIEGFFGIFILLYEVVIGLGKGAAALGKYAIFSDYREEMNKQISEVARFVAENVSSGNIKKIDKKMIADIFAKEMEKVQAVPTEQQAHMIGKMAGNIIGAIASGMFIKGIVRSATTRIAYKAPEAVMKGTEILGGAEKATKRLSISKARTWKELDEAIEQIDHIRFKDGFKGEDVRELVEAVKNGTKPISSLPHAGGLQDKVAALKAGGGEIAESTGLKKVMELATEKTKELSQKAIGIALKDIAKRLPEVAKRLESIHTESKTLTKTGYDAIDMKITRLRTDIEGAIDRAKTATKGTIGTVMSPVGALVAEITKEAASVNFPGKEQLMASLEAIGKSVKGMKEVAETASGKIKSVFASEVNPSKQLSKKAVEKLRFEGGFAIDEIKNNEGKTLFYQYRDTNGKVAFSGKFKEAGNFHDGQATVKVEIATESGPKEVLGIIDKKGKWVLEPKFDVLHSMSDTVKIGKEGEKYVIFRLEEREARKGKKTMEWIQQKDVFDFMTDPREGMAVAVKKIDGKELKFIISKEGVVKKVDYHYVDDFTSEGVAAAQDHEGMWHIINRDGKPQGDIKASSNLEALDQYHMRKFEQEGQVSNILEQRAKKLWDRYDFAGKDGMELTGIVPLPQKGVFLVQVEVDGAVKKGLINVNTNRIAPPQFDHIQRSDGNLGFFRVKQNGKWGIIDGELEVDGKMKMLSETKYDSINFQDDVLHLMEVRIGDNVGLIDRTGKEIIPVEFSDILSDRIGVFRGVKYDANFKPVAMGAIKDFSKEFGASTYAEKDFIGKTIDTGRNINLARSAEHKSARTYRNETSELIREVKQLDLQKVLVGFNDTQKGLSLRFSKFAKEIRTVEDLDQLDRLIDTTVWDEFKTYARNYGHALTRDEKTVLKQKRKSIAQELKLDIRNQIKRRYNGDANVSSEGSETQKLIGRLTENINPKLFMTIGKDEAKKDVLGYGT